MDDKDIEMLLAIQRTQSITHAAELLFINQSSLSKRLQQLERQLSTKLVIRTNQGIHFTSAGRSALKTAKQIKRLNNELKESLSVDDSEFSGTLNLGCSIDYAQYELPDLLVAFQTKYPQIQLNITIDYSRSILQKLLTDDSVNVGIIRGEFKGPLKKVPIVTEGINLICQTPEDSQRLSDLPYIQRKSMIISKLK
ncbi:LysR family transcriptional regulator [Secundilactobacillus kimchicus]|uniref:LysR family transcriptional regulator n=1 Tax=Secundilactobacillus kimchicus TaxID=528209 RepID=UPI0006D10C4B|nr:LysR family transcriptional regulator [Secundilactobacillus kimchicus]